MKNGFWKKMMSVTLAFAMMASVSACSAKSEETGATETGSGAARGHRSGYDNDGKADTAESQTAGRRYL